ncbi:MAG: hypothetical protein IPG11_10490 [Flavobacteriales bacterium]|nr:hypothetical protein [Flavobacteriales bacterium]
MQVLSQQIGGLQVVLDHLVPCVGDAVLGHTQSRLPVQDLACESVQDREDVAVAPMAGYPFALDVHLQHMQGAFRGDHPVLHVGAFGRFASWGQQVLLLHEPVSFLRADVVAIKHQSACGLLVSMVGVGVAFHLLYPGDDLTVRHHTRAPSCSLCVQQVRGLPPRPALGL